MLRGLIRKDYRLLRVYILLTLAGMVLGYIMSYGTVRMLPNFTDELTRFAVTMAGASKIGLVLTFLSAGIIAGSAFSLERADRSADFLASLPPTRMQNLLSKAVVVLSTISCFIGVNLIAAFIAWRLLPYSRFDATNFGFEWGIYYLMSACVLCVGGIAWAGSAVMNSNGGPILLGLFSPLVVSSLLHLSAWIFDVHVASNETSGSRFANACVVMGAVGFATGCHWYLNKTSP